MIGPSCRLLFRRIPIRFWVRGLVSVTTVLLLWVGASSLPRFSVEQQTACRTCHVNPNGGGMRTEFGNHAVALHELCLPSTKEKIAPHVASPRVAPGLLVGFDARYLVMDDGSIFRMQTDAYADFNPFSALHYHVRIGAEGISENYGLLYFNDERYYVKAGRFYPAYGLRNADHTAFVRERTGHLPGLYLDGLSVGADIRGVNVVAEGFDVGGRGIYGVHLYGVRNMDKLGLLAGASLRLSEQIQGGNGQFPHSRSIFGGLSYDRFTLLGELDAVGRAPDTLVAYANLTTRLEHGLYLVGEYNFFDEDRDRKGRVHEFLRLSAEVFPVPFVQFRPSYTRYTRGDLSGTDDFFVQMHFGY